MNRLRPLGRWLTVTLLALALAPAAQARLAGPIAVKIVIFSSGAGPDAVSFVYSTPARGAKARRELETEARQDFRRLAAAFRQPAPPVKITTLSSPVQAPPTTSAEGKLQHLVNRPAGWLNIGPFLEIFRRYDRLSLTYFVAPPFQFRGPRGPFDDPALAMTLDVEGSAYTYEVRIKPGSGGQSLPAFEGPGTGRPLGQVGGLAGMGIWANLLIALIALTAGVVVYALLQYWVQRRT